MSLIDEYNQLYPEILNDTRYVYFACDDCIIIMEKLLDSITNESRSDIYDPLYATYMANKLKVVKIFKKYYPNDELDSVTSIEFCNIMKYEVGKIIISDCTLMYYKSIICSMYHESYHCCYTGKYISWYDNGCMCERGNYKEGNKEGLWEYFYSNGQQSMKVVYSNGIIVEKLEFDKFKENQNMQIVNYNPINNESFIQYYANIIYPYLIDLIVFFNIEFNLFKKIKK